MVQASTVCDLVEYRNEGGINAANITGKNKGREHEGKIILDSSDSNKDAEKKRHEPEVGLQMMAEGSGSDENDDQNKRWMEFVHVAETKAIPNFEAYIKAKAIRTETSIRFVNAIDACIQTLRDTTDGVLSNVVEPICNQYSERFNGTEENIIKTMVSNHSRRNKLLELMHNADAAWSNNYNKLTAEIMGDVSNVTESIWDPYLYTVSFILPSCFRNFQIRIKQIKRVREITISQKKWERRKVNIRMETELLPETEKVDVGRRVWSLRIFRREATKRKPFLVTTIPIGKSFSNTNHLEREFYPSWTNA
jgi:hypothetical protein